MSRQAQAARSVAVIILLSLLGKLLGFIREVLIAAQFGSGLETDAFFVALTACGLLGAFLVSAIHTILIPMLARVEARDGKLAKHRHINNLANIVLIASLILSGIAWLIGPSIVSVVASGFSGQQFDLAVRLFRLGIWALVFSGLIAVFRGFLQSESLFTESAASQLPLNIVYIVFLIFFAKTFGIHGLMVTSVLAVLSQLLLSTLGLYRIGFKYKYVFNLRDSFVTESFRLIPPVLFGVAITDLNKVVDRTLASSLSGGSISALSYAVRINTLVIGIFVSALSTVIYPRLAKAAAAEGFTELHRILTQTVNYILLISIPSAFGTAVLAKPIVEVAFERGAFNAQATIMTAGALSIYGIGLVEMALRPVLTRAFYALRDTKTPTVYGALCVAGNIVLSLVLVRFMGLNGLALGTSVAGTVSTLLLFRALGSRGVASSWAKCVKVGLQATSASIIMSLFAHFSYYSILNYLGGTWIAKFMSLCLAVGLAGIAYAMIVYFMGIVEVRRLVAVTASAMQRQFARM